MKFTLTYEGELRTSSKKSGGRSSADRKHELRSHFHHQLQRLWQVNGFLKNWAKKVDHYNHSRMEDLLLSNSPKIASMGFIPLVSRAVCLDCWVDFRILRPSHDSVNAPDIDNQVKVLFDALKMPRTQDEMGKNFDQSSSPMYVLLEDDSLVTKITSTQDELLQPVPGKTEVQRNDVRVLIGVHIRPQIPLPENVIFYSEDGATWDHGYYDGLPDNLSHLSSTQLKVVATQIIFRIRALAEAFGQWNSGRRSSSSKSNLTEEERKAAWDQETNKLIADSHSQRQTWQLNLWPKARAIKGELNRRIYPAPPYPDTEHSVAIDHGMLAGPHPLADAAAELEDLVRRMP